MRTVAAPLTVTFYFETSRAAGKPEEILTHMCHEQTTTGYDTLEGRAAAPRLAPAGRGGAGRGAASPRGAGSGRRPPRRAPPARRAGQ